MKDKVLSLLGLCMKAGKAVSGEFMTESAVKEGKAFLVIVATDASDNTKKDIKNMCAFYKTACYEYSTKEQLGNAIGKELRSSVTICDEGFSNALKIKLDNM